MISSSDPREPLAQAFSLSGKTAVITGGVGGIGAAIATAMSAAGAVVAINGRDPEQVARAVVQVPRAIPAVFDITNHAAAAQEIARVVAVTGSLDILVCNAAMRDRRPFHEITASSYRDLLETNLVSAFELGRLAAAAMQERGSGRLIFISSTAAQRPFRGDPSYTSSKAALEGLVRSLAGELGPRGITANAVAPGFTSTDFNAPMMSDPGIAEFVQTRVPLGRWGRPQDIAHATVFLASDAASYVNGHVLTVDGGLSAVL